MILKVIGWFLNLIHKINPHWGGKVAMYLFSHPNRKKIDPKQKKYLQKSLWKKYSLDGNVYACYKWGNGPINVLMAHGWQSHSYRWKKYIDHFDTKKFSFYAFDAPANGLTKGTKITIPIYGKAIYDIAKMIGNIHILMGHSFGGINCLYALSQYDLPSVKKLILLASPSRIKLFMNYFQNKLGLSTGVINSLYKVLENELGRSVHEFNGEHFASTLTIDGLIIHDKNDSNTDPNDSIAINKAWSSSQLILTEGLNHKLNQPQIIQKIKNFIENSL